MSSNIEEPDSSHYDSMHHYVNVTFHQHKEEEEEERKPALPPRLDKTRLEGTGGCGAQNEYEKIKEREDDLERIHKRSRELIRGHFDGPPTNNSFRPARHAVIIKDDHTNAVLLKMIRIKIFSFAKLSVNNLGNYPQD